MKYIYFGSSTFSRIVLEGLCRQGLSPCLIVSQPDKPCGRGLKVMAMQVSLFAVQNNIAVIKPQSLSDVAVRKHIEKEAADLFIVADYGKILPLSLLSLPKILPIALHPSLLPRYRGAAPINYALINGDSYSGVTVFKINKKLDSGEIIMQEQIAIEEKDDAVTLSERLAVSGVKVIADTMALITGQNYRLSPQDENEASYAPKLKKEDGRINWNLEPNKIKNLIRGLTDWPSAYTYYKGKLLKIIQAEVLPAQIVLEPGVITSVDKSGIGVCAGRGILLIKKVKPQDKNEMDAYSFVLGHRVQLGDKFE